MCTTPTGSVESKAEGDLKHDAISHSILQAFGPMIGAERDVKLMQVPCSMSLRSMELLHLSVVHTAALACSYTYMLTTSLQQTR